MESVKVTMSYEPPVISDVRGASGSTQGGNLVTILGNYLGLWEAAELAATTGPSVTLGGSACAVTLWTYTNITCRAPAGSGTIKQFVVSVPRRRTDGTQSIAVVQPAAGAKVAYNYLPPRIDSVVADPSVHILAGRHSPTVGGTRVIITGDSLGTGTAPGVGLFVNGKAVAILVQNDTSITFLSPPGSGLDNPIQYSVDGQTIRMGGFNYLAPVISSIQADDDAKTPRCYVGTSPCMRPRINANGAALSLLGSNFGFQASAVVKITLVDAHGRTIICAMPATSGMWVSDALLRCASGALRVGPYGLVVMVANQTVSISAESGPWAECRAGFFGSGLYDALCYVCPGSVDALGNPNPKASVCAGGDAMPISALQYWLNSPATSASANYTVELCRPPVACTGNNTCAEGYTGTGCALCVPHTFHRDLLSGLCAPCPNQAALVLTGYFFAFVVVGVLLYKLYRKGPSVAAMGITVDYFQVLSVFVDLNMNWPPIMLDFFRYASLFTANVEITSPECSISVGYVPKWYFMEAVPIMMLVCGALFHVGHNFHRFRIARRKNRVFYWKDANTLLGAFIISLSFLYIFLVRKALEVFNCVPVGSNMVLEIDPSVPCSGPVYAQLWQ